MLTPFITLFFGLLIPGAAWLLLLAYLTESARFAYFASTPAFYFCLARFVWTGGSLGFDPTIRIFALNFVIALAAAFFLTSKE